MNTLIHHLRRTAFLPHSSTLSDGQLLEYFLARRDEVAFETLVRRHGPMVLGVCRRVVGNAHDADDAFQATFLVLVRKAASIVPREAVGNWLYGVAYRTALEARGTLARRRAREKQVKDMPQPPVEPEETWQELLPLLDEELTRLPDKYRLPVVLCELEGRPRKEVARQLGLPEGTLSSRLAAARKLLAGRLAPRGRALSAGTVAAALSCAEASACVPKSLVVSTVRAALFTTAGPAAAGGVISAPVAALAEAVLKCMFLTKLKSVTVVLLALAIAGAGAGLMTHQACVARPPNSVLPSTADVPPASEKQGSKKADLNLLWSQGKAEGKGPIRLTTFPLRVEDISHISPMGMMASGHTTPSDHLYLVPREPTKGQLFDVLAVADGQVVVIQWRPNPPGGQPDPTVFDRAVDLKVVIEHAATMWSYVDHLVELDPAIQKQVGRALKAGPPIHTRVPVKAGQVIGKVAGQRTFDFALIDTTVTRKGFVAPEQFFQRDPWKLHTVDPFDYVEEPLRGRLLAFNPRQAKPVGGQLDYDIDGRLVGNWYRENSGGYAGLNKRWDYWVGHLTFAYHHVDPTQVIISIGELDGRARQFQVRGNGPDPAKVSKEDAVVKYSLIAPGIDNRTGKPLADYQERFYGALLVQVLDGRKLRVEVFPGKTTEEVKGFTKAAWIYQR